MPREPHRTPDDVRALFAIGLTGHDPVRQRFLGTPPDNEARRSRLLALLDRASKLTANLRRR
jgi:hypothetical protein